jgi:hypothetical protein
MHCLIQIRGTNLNRKNKMYVITGILDKH